MISAVLEYLRKEYGAKVDGSYYAEVEKWKSWWEGYYKPFHYFESREGEMIKGRKRYSLRMAKKICEDWASILLNEKTEVVIDDKASSDYIIGVEGTGGVFGANQFWQKGNALMEKSFATGTGAVVLRFHDMAVKNGRIIADKGASIGMDFLPAQNIVPLTIRHGKVIDAAFVSEATENGQKYIYIETHVLKNGSYNISNRYFKLDKGESLKPATLPEGVAAEVRLATDTPMFALVSPNIVNNIDDGCGLGLSVYADALDILQGVDLAYNNFNRDFYLGGKKVFINSSLTKTDRNGNIITPDDVSQQLFATVGETDFDGSKPLIEEFNPALRIEDNTKGIQAQLDYLSFKCGLGTKHYQFNLGSIVTATQYMGDKQELVQNAAKHYIAVEQFLTAICKAVLWAGREICAQPVNPDAAVTVNFEDSYIVDKESERTRDLQELRDGIMQPWEFRVKWYGESEEEAKAALSGSGAGLGFGDV